jgi:hypothetical protein
MPRANVSKTAPKLAWQLDETRTRELRDWLQRNTNCLARSRYPEQVAATVSRYLLYASRYRAPPSDDQLWRYLLEARCVETWLTDLEEEAGLGPSAVYNAAGCLQRALDYAFCMRGIEAPGQLLRYLSQKRRLYRGRRRQAAAARRDREVETGPAAIERLYTTLLDSRETRARIDLALEPFRDNFVGAAPASTRAAYLLVLRAALASMLLSVATRPSAVYTLTLGRLRDVHWDLDEVVLVSPAHKTSRSSGPVRIVLRGTAKAFVRDYVTVARPALLRSLGDEEQETDSQPAFVNARGKPLNSSQMADHLRQLQRTLGIVQPITATDVRKAVVTRLRGQAADPTALARSMAHSRRTATRHYDLGDGRGSHGARALQQAIARTCTVRLRRCDAPQ